MAEIPTEKEIDHYFMLATMFADKATAFDISLPGLGMVGAMIAGISVARADPNLEEIPSGLNSAIMGTMRAAFRLEVAKLADGEKTDANDHK